MEILKIDNRTKKVFVLARNEERIVYIPVKSCHRVDYERLIKAEKEKPNNVPLLDYLKKTKFDNGRNALAVLDNLIQVANLSDEKNGMRLPKPDEAESFNLSSVDKEEKDEKQSVTENTNVPSQNDVLVDPTDKNKPVAGQEYRYTDKNGHPKIWTGQGRMPNAIKEAIDQGKSLPEFAVKS